MNKLYSLLICLFAFSASAYSQTHSFQSNIFKDEIESLKIAHITQIVGLTADEAVRFWPVYNAYWQKKQELSRARRDLGRKVSSNTAPSNGLALYIELEEQRYELVKQTAKEFGHILSPERVLKVFIAEQSFKRILLERHHQHH